MKTLPPPLTHGRLPTRPPCDVRVPGGLESAVRTCPIALHSIAYAPREDLHGRVVDCSTEGFATAMDVSCHSFLRMARHRIDVADVGALAAFLVSDAAHRITGTIISVDGGQHSLA